MIMWKKYYSNNLNKMIKKKSVDDLNVDIVFNQDHQIYENGQIFMSICNYLKIDLTNYFRSSLTFFELKKVQKFFINVNKQKFGIKKGKKYLNDIVQKYVKLFLNIIFVLENIKTRFYQSCFFLLSNQLFQKQNFLIFYIIYFNFSMSNTNLQITESNGKSKIFYSAGLLDLKGKQKILRRLVLVRLFNLLTLLKLKFIKNAPVALHLKNVGSNKFLIINKLKRKFFIKIIKTFELNAYNGCRKKKERRKRQKKKKK